MAYGPRYSSYQYDTSPRKLQPEYEPIQRKPYSEKSKVTKKVTKKKVQTNYKKKAKRKLKPQAKAVVWIGIAFAILFAISYQNSLITQSFNEKENLKKELATIQKENEQLKVNIENSLNLNNIEQLAKERLGMQKLDNSQKKYISLDKKDYVESATEEVIIEKEQTLWEKIISSLTQSLK